jgi:hypothetical protein
MVDRIGPAYYAFAVHEASMSEQRDHNETTAGDDAPAPSPPGEGTKAAPVKIGPVKIEPVKIRPVEIGGRAGPDPTRYGDWEKGGRCIDF